jgi:glycerol-3-phosphate dehydrogenase (NAD(P)+)
MFNSILVVGSGNWGTTFARLLANNNLNVTLHVHEEDLFHTIKETGRNTRYLPDIVLPENLKYIHKLENLETYELVVLAVPANVVGIILNENKDNFAKDVAFLNLSKGIELSSGKRMSEVIAKIFPDKKRIASLSGPNIATEIAKEKPAIAVIASNDMEYARALQKDISTAYFRLYVNPDLPGVEICGSMKNIIAIGAGICHELELGDNTIAALITRGIAEMSRFGRSYGCNPLTFMGMAGVGDLSVTCMSPHSRNNRVGRLMARGMSLEEAQKTLGMVAEGVFTCQIVHKIATEQNIYLPITDAIHRILFEQVPPLQAIQELMEGNLKHEVDME